LLFLMRACPSGACVVAAFPRETRQAFLEAHAQACELVGDGFSTFRYDNLASAVAKVLECRRRIEIDRSVALRSHDLFSPEFTHTGKEVEHEKGRVEGGVGGWRRTFMVRMPEIASLAELNELTGGYWSMICIARSATVARPSGRRSAARVTGSEHCRRSDLKAPSTRARGWTPCRW
jgi:hypothetical protein